MVLTERGRQLFAVGKLDFSYFGLFDDGLDYDPYPADMTDDERAAKIEATPVLESSFVHAVHGTAAPLEPISHLFTAAPGFVSIPRMTSPSDGDQLDLVADQRKKANTYTRTGTNMAQIDLEVVGDIEQGNPGFIVRVMTSGSNGLQELGLRRDLDGRRSFDPFLAASIDSERVVDKANVGDPSSSRVQDRKPPRKR